MSEYDNAEGKMNSDTITKYREIRVDFKIPIETKTNKQNRYSSVDVKEELDRRNEDLRKHIKNMNDEFLQTFLNNYFKWKLFEKLNISKVISELLPRPFNLNIVYDIESIED